jgi:3-oxoacyl-[acyl-carrier protein] reductase
MPLDLTGKSALVTGGTRGIGRAIVEALAGAGARVAFTYRSSTETAEALRAELAGRGVEALAIQGDAADAAHAEDAVKQTLDAFGSIDVLVNNAGITKDTLLIRMSEADWDAVIETNLKSVFNFSKAAYRPMMKQRSGSVINVS